MLAKSNDNKHWLTVAFYSSLFFLLLSQNITWLLSYFLKQLNPPASLLILVRALPHQLLILTAILLASKYIEPQIPILEKLSLKKFKWSYLLISGGFAILLVPINAIITLASQVTLKYFFNINPKPEIIKYLLNCDNYSFVIFFLIAILVAPIVEELFFRKVMYEFFRKYLNSIPALLITCFIFAAIHNNLLQFAGLFILAITLQTLYIKNSSLYPTILLHFFNNLFSMSILTIIRLLHITYS